MYNFGRITTYQAAKGFGFITHQDSAQEIFFHIADFPAQGGAPKINEQLKFLIVEDRGKFKASDIQRLDVQGAVSQADKSVKENSMKSSKHLQNNKAASPHKLRYLILIVTLIVMGIGLFFAWQQYQHYKIQQQYKVQNLMQQQQQIIAAQRKAVGDVQPIPLSEKTQRALEHNRSSTLRTTMVSNTQTAPQVSNNSPALAKFSCDGRKHCSQMHSYEEALFFLRNCPNTKMDGDGDGIPCEKQFR